MRLADVTARALAYGNNCKEVGTITISGGAVTATGNNTDGIRGYNDETDFSSGAGRRALILASSISDKFQQRRLERHNF